MKTIVFIAVVLSLLLFWSPANPAWRALAFVFKLLPLIVLFAYIHHCMTARKGPKAGEFGDLLKDAYRAKRESYRMTAEAIGTPRWLVPIVVIILMLLVFFAGC